MQEYYPEHRFFKAEKVIEKVLKQNNLQEVLYYTKILKHWELIIGKPLSKKAVPLKLQKKVLFIGVVDSAYSHHLRFYEPNILELIASPEICGDGAVKKIVFRTTRKRTAQNNPSAPHLKTGAQNTLSKADSVRAEKTSLQIKDQRLKKIFSRYMAKTISK
ncbi:MAG: DUF721 domain-containing protein [Deltaproteobacteria bacterium]|jgi:hypothetical protein|nr:DUF721 domain-containing protein [Deltaproteobacteria bacterium]MBT4087299.1 DUF721 domain-containing protein [Deltaproteobacteria bacterium]MBT4266236.1 DUF721 domain-containing protein [Deltaproteobacteria bacterium]MBT4639947.1 DUF721 domain-containing protein [Deltaproteobacteria bacterium]MBT6500942.1 DUF721 domain-containing protein [Deltaproteobacteria bacterium]